MPDNEQQLVENEVAMKVQAEVSAVEEASALEAEKENQEQAEIEEEMNYANQLAAAQDDEEEVTKKQAEDIKKEGTSFGSPSFIKYFILLFVFAVPNDAIDALELTVLLTILSWFASIFLSMGSILFSWLTDHEQQRADQLQVLQALCCLVRRDSESGGHVPDCSCVALVWGTGLSVGDGVAEFDREVRRHVAGLHRLGNPLEEPGLESIERGHAVIGHECAPASCGLAYRQGQ